MRRPHVRQLDAAGLGPAGIRGFEAGIARHADDAPIYAPPTVERLFEIEWRRGVQVARAWRRLRNTNTDADDLLIRAVAAAEGFERPDPLAIHRIARSVHTGDLEYLRDEVVTFFHHDGPNGILAPTHPTAIVHDGATWTSVEALYQAQKHAEPDLREAIRLAPDALSAKAVSRTTTSDRLPMRDHFRIGRRVAMARALMLRSEQDEAFRHALAATRGRALVEHVDDGGDSRWGALGRLALRGWNLQGRLLAAVRDELP